jgi:hypothetical protein
VKRAKKKLSEWDRGFMSGVLACLYHLHHGHGESTMYRELAESNGPADLWEAADEHDREHLRANGFDPKRKGNRYLAYPRGTP